MKTSKRKSIIGSVFANLAGAILLVVTVFAIVGAGAAQAETIVLNDVSAEVLTSSNGSTGTGHNTTTVLDIGSWSTTSYMHVGFVFQMTGISNPSWITTANFSVSVSYVHENGAKDSIDAHVVRTAASAAFLNSDYETSAQLLMSPFDAPTYTTGLHNLDDTGKNTLGTWLKNNWVEGNYVFISLQTVPIISPARGVNRYGSSANNDSKLTITYILPPPGTVLILR